MSRQQQPTPDGPLAELRLRPGVPGRLTVSAVAFALVLVPGVGLYAASALLGASLGVRTGLGVLGFLLGMGVYPFYLKRRFPRR